MVKDKSCRENRPGQMQDQREVLELWHVVHVNRLEKETVCFPNKDYKICTKWKKKHRLLEHPLLDIASITENLYHCKRRANGRMSLGVPAQWDLSSLS